MGKKHKIRPEDDEPLSLDMTFEAALDLLLSTPPPPDEEQSELEQEQDSDEDI